MTTRFVPFATLALLAAGSGLAQDAITCQSSSSPVTVRKEGLTEPLGVITLDCRGGAAGTRLAGTLTVFLNRALANRVVNDAVPEALLQIDTGSGARTLAATATRNGSSGIGFAGFSFDIPASRRFVLQVSRLRAEIAGSDLPVTATLSLSGLNNLALNGSFLVVGQPLTGLFSSLSFANVQGTTKPLPATFEEAASNAQPSFTARVTEGFSTAFAPRLDGADSGVRVMLRYTNVPSGVRFTVPDVIAGSSAPEPTAAGSFGGGLQAGRTAPGTLLLARVLQPAADGSGGVLATFGQGLPFGALREVPLSASGAGVAVYEVLDGNTFLTESAQIPTFIEIQTLTSGTSRTSVTFAPVRAPSNGGGAPIPSFIDVAPDTDCQTTGDCQSGPRLVVNADPLVVTGMEATGFQIRYVRINNAGPGGFIWTAKVTYANGSDWLRIDRTEGVSSATIRLDFLPDKVPGPGIYNATLTIDAGATAGSRVLPVQFVVTENPVLRGPQITASGHAATFEEEVVAGGLAYLRGVRLEGRNVEVKVGGVAARTTFRSASQINFEVPPALFGRNTADLVVTVDGTSSLPRPLKFKPVWPAVFPGGVLNEGGAVNGAAQPAPAGSTIRVLATGVPVHALLTIFVRLGALENIRPTLTTDDGSPGVQTLDFTLPEGATAPAMDLQVCAAEVCGPAVKLYVAP